ncbi:MAG: hypothetical protein ABF679_07660 [Lentilactobacillus diolivorans]|uniref:hypothetical protein n=1 Tax=Lentilactobacillus diolivorans TaxID=179838 RepID=UPI0039EAB787
MKNKENLTGAQIVGWIIWWFVTVILVLTLITVMIFKPTSWIVNIVLVILGGLYLAQQIIVFFGLKRLHQNNGYVWPIVMMIIGILGSLLYIIPGIWALIINNNRQKEAKNK